MHKDRNVENAKTGNRGQGKRKKSLKKKLPRQRTPLCGPQRGPAAASKALPFS